jgi:CRISPR-associated protein Cmr6
MKKEPTISEAFISKNESYFDIEIDGIDEPQLPSEDYFNFEGFDHENFFEIHHFGNIIYRIFQNSKEVPQINSKILFDFINQENGNSIGGKNIPKDYNFLDFDLSMPFLVEFGKKNQLKLVQNKEEVIKYDYREVTNVKWEVYSDKLKEVVSLEIMETKQDYSSIFEIGYNYKEVPIKSDNSKSNSRLPFDTNVALKESDIDNFNLHFNKYVHHTETQDKERKLVLYRKEVREVFKNVSFDKELIKTVSENHYSQISKLKYNFDKLENISPNWRLIIGLGGASVYETSMTLHHIYGFPYIPASSVKGVLRSWILVNYFNGSEDKNAEEKAGKCENFQKIFGTQEAAGKITFFDAFPTKPPKIEVDVMTPHYGDYYTDNENKKRIAPTDTMSPNPIPFLTVADTPFQFLFGSKDFEINQKLWTFEEGGEAKTLSEWLKFALENHGIGAKTAVGYGYMQ